MLRILVAGTIDREGLNLLKARDDIEYEVLEQPDSTTIENHIGKADALILRLTPVGENKTILNRRKTSVSWKLATCKRPMLPPQASILFLKKSLELMLAGVLKRKGIYCLTPHKGGISTMVIYLTT